MVDQTCAGIVEAWLREHGVAVRAGVTLTKIEDARGKRRLHFKKGEPLTADVVIMATGIRTNLEWLKGSGVELADGAWMAPALLGATAGHHDRAELAWSPPPYELRLTPLPEHSLTFDFVLQRLLHGLERVHVLHLGLRVEFGFTQWAQRDIGVAAQVTFLHVPVAHAEHAHDLPQLAQEGRTHRGVFGGRLHEAQDDLLPAERHAQRDHHRIVGTGLPVQHQRHQVVPGEPALLEGAQLARAGVDEAPGHRRGTQPKGLGKGLCALPISPAAQAQQHAP
jgi:hypothetical protein